MSIFRKFTLRSLQKNRVRSIVTVIGIMLSMAMFTAVIEAAYSGVRFLIRAEEKKTGSYHAYYSGLGADDVRTLENADGVKRPSHGSRWAGRISAVTIDTSRICLSNR